jgi:hypothetical protein
MPKWFETTDMTSDYMYPVLSDNSISPLFVTNAIKLYEIVTFPAGL